MSDQKPILSAQEIAAAAFAFQHPMVPECGCQLAPMSRMAGMARGAINLVRIAPGGQAFPFHRHHGQEEWVYVVSGTGEIQLDDQANPVGPGAFAVFAAAGPAHAVRNTGAEEMVCLMGGDAPTADVVDFPDIGQRVTKTDAGYEAAPTDAFKPVQPKVPEGGGGS